MTAHAPSGPILELFPVLFWSWMTNLYAFGIHSIPGPDVLRHGQEARDMPAHVYYERILLLVHSWNGRGEPEH